MDSSLRIIVTGLIAQHPLLGGITWHYLQYILGLARLGHDIYYFEDSGEFPYNLDGGASGNDWIASNCSYNVDYLARVMSRVGLDNRWAYRFPLKSQWFGLSYKQRVAVVRSADLLINVSGTLERPEDYRRIPRSLYIDTDPVVTQIKLAVDIDGFRQRVDSHDLHFSFGESLSNNVPATGHNWLSTRQPIVLSEWRDSAPLQRDVFTTVMNWTSYKPLVYSGRTYGQKDVEFQRFLTLPREIAPVAIEVAFSRTEHLEWQTGDGTLPVELTELAGGPKWTACNVLIQNGWHVVDAIDACGDLDSYRHFIQSSKAEWTVAKNAYVIGQPGWFSERSACYLAAGKPVIVQDTGLVDVLPVGKGILLFKTIEEAVAAIEEVQGNYAREAEAAQAIAEEYFDSDKVLTRLIQDALIDK